jgi:Asp-tRNA(Asn)/Glu-tRNA(Gln) amidotransferase A subunit family amidase
MGFSEDGLPIGVQIAGRPWEEERVLAVASVLERARGPLQACRLVAAIGATAERTSGV